MAKECYFRVLKNHYLKTEGGGMVVHCHNTACFQLLQTLPSENLSCQIGMVLVI